MYTGGRRKLKRELGERYEGVEGPLTGAGREEEGGGVWDGMAEGGEGVSTRAFILQFYEQTLWNTEISLCCTGQRDLSKCELLATSRTNPYARKCGPKSCLYTYARKRTKCKKFFFFKSPYNYGIHRLLQ